ncbi:MAG: MgtC/SapB family protein [Clostridia bacterium]|nr:MgtC/SapB family protein [Clostridia bacterium]
MTSQFTLWQYLDFFIRLIVAGLCGVIFGFERNKRSKDAGIRTHFIVCCAAALVMIVSKYAFVDLTGVGGTMFNGTSGADPARVAAQVVSGISFLCAGVIFKNGSTVRGLTTAAGIWATAGIGLAIGAGMYALGIFTTVAIQLIQFILHRYQIGVDTMAAAKVRFNIDKASPFKAQLFKQFEDWKMHTDGLSVNEEPDGTLTYELQIKYPMSMGLDTIMLFFENNSSELKNYSVSNMT